MKLRTRSINSDGRPSSLAVRGEGGAERSTVAPLAEEQEEAEALLSAATPVEGGRRKDDEEDLVAAEYDGTLSVRVRAAGLGAGAAAAAAAVGFERGSTGPATAATVAGGDSSTRLCGAGWIRTRVDADDDDDDDDDVEWVWE